MIAKTAELTMAKWWAPV